MYKPPVTALLSFSIEKIKINWKLCTEASIECFVFIDLDCNYRLIYL